MVSLLNQAMLMLAAQPNAIFLGQGVASDGVATFKDLEGIPMEQRIEFPVAEDLQLGCCTGLAMQGFLPIAVYPRLDFLLLAMSQLVLHLDKLEQMSRGQWKPKVIIRTRVGSKTPLDAGPQHTGCYATALRYMLSNIDVLEIEKPKEIMPMYRYAVQSTRSVIVVEKL